MTIKWVDIEAIKPYDNNPRINDRAVDAVAASIKQFGWNQPIVVDRNNVIIAGHTRYRAALTLGIKQIPVKTAELTNEQATAYRIADNKTAELSSWDSERLSVEMGDIHDIDMRDFGFTDNDIFDFDTSDQIDDTDSHSQPPTESDDEQEKRIIITYRTEQEESFLKNLLGIEKIQENISLEDLNTLKKGERQ